MKKTRIMGLGVTLALTGCTLLDDNGETAREVEAKTAEWKKPSVSGEACLMVLPDADTQDNRGTQAEAIYGDLDYSEGIWRVRETQAIIGFSQYEDAIIWSSSECAATMPEYMTE